MKESKSTPINYKMSIKTAPKVLVQNVKILAVFEDF